MVISNSFLFYLDEEKKGKVIISEKIDQVSSVVVAQDDEELRDLIENGNKDIFQRIDSILYTYSFEEKWLKEIFTDSLYIKKVRVPKDIPLVKYNKLMLKILGNLNIVPDKVLESEYSNSLTFYFRVEDDMAAKMVVRSDSRINGELKLAARMIIIIDDFGNQWSPEYIQDYLSFPVPITLSVIPGHIFSKRTAERGHQKGKEIMIHMPMEPLRGSIEKESVKIISGMDKKTITTMMEKAVKDVPHAVGLNNHEGSKGTTDSDLMESFFDIFHDYNMFFVNSLTTGNTFCKKFAAINKVEYAERNIFLDDINDEKHIEKMFRKGVARVLAGKDVILIGHTRKITSRTLKRLVTEEFPELNYAFASEVVELVPLVPEITEESEISEKNR